MVAVEALARWDHPAQGMLHPSAFIPLAEETGLMGQIGHNVLREACARVALWQRSFDGMESLLINVNLTPSEISPSARVPDRHAEDRARVRRRPAGQPGRHSVLRDDREARAITRARSRRGRHRVRRAGDSGQAARLRARAGLLLRTAARARWADVRVQCVTSRRCDASRRLELLRTLPAPRPASRRCARARGNGVL